MNRLIIFDLDGTLVDTAPDLAEAMNAVLTRHGYGALPAQSVRLMVGRGARVLLELGLKANGACINNEDIDQLVVEFIQIYEENLTVKSRPFEFVEQTLDGLLGRGWTLAVCTNKPEKLSKLLLTELHLRDRFSTVVGGDTLAVTKPQAEPILEVMSRCQAKPIDTIMVGDSITDINAARNAKIPVIGVTFGYSETPIKDLGADLIIDGFQELAAAIDVISLRFRQT
jgi:phosphoglycolate phosphatase